MRGANIAKGALITTLVMGLVLIVVSVSFAQVKTQVRVPFRIGKTIERDLSKISKNLIGAKLKMVVAKSRETRSKTTVIERISKDEFLCETIAVSLDKATDTAYLSRILFRYDKGQAKDVKVEKDYKLEVSKPTMARRDLRLERSKKNVVTREKVKMPPIKTDAREYEKDLKMSRILREAKKVKKERGRSWWYASGLVDLVYTDKPTVTKYESYVWWVMYNSWKWGILAHPPAWRYGSKATKSEILNFLRYDSYLVAWQHKGHGNPSLIVMWDGNIWAGEISALWPIRGLYCCVAFVNSCNVCHDPIRAAFLSRRPRTYIAPTVSVSSNRSAKANYYFWYQTLYWNKPMATALNNAANWAGLSGQFCLERFGGRFRPYNCAWK